MDKRYKILYSKFHLIKTKDLQKHHDNDIHFDVQPFYRQNEFQNHLSSAISHCTAQEFADILHPLLLQMEHENAENRPGSMLCFELLFHQLIIALLRTDFKESPQAVYGSSPQTDEKKIVDKAIDFIQHNLEKPVRIKDICEYLHISESYLHKIFSSQIRFSPNQMILLCKVKRAEQLLKTANYSIKEISEMLCFSSQYYFSTVFKRFYGISPRDFQNLL